MRAEIVSVGTEILLGHIVDTNANYLAQELTALGIDLFWVSTAGDNLPRLAEIVARAFGRSDLTIITGGVGPTEDDLTREAVAAALGEEMKVIPELEADLRAFFGRRNRPMPERNVKQATLIPSAQPLANPIGTAPGWWVERDGHIIVTMPGVPPEMFKMWREQAVPRLLGRESAALYTRILKVLGLGESHVEEMISSLLASNNPTIATYAKNDGIHVRITAKAADLETAKSILAPMEAEARRILGDGIYGVDDETVDSIVGRILAERGLTLGVVEGVTGGLIASGLSDVANAAAFFRGGLVVTSTAQLAAWSGGAAGVADGEVSAEVATAMARSARAAFGADIGLGISGVGGPESIGGQRPGTMHIAVDYRGEIVVDSGIGFGNTRAQIKGRASLAAVDLLRRHLQKTT